MSENDTQVTEAIVYIPSDLDGWRLHIAPGSGIVGTPLGKDGVMLYFEGNVYNATNLRTVEERIVCAAGRLFTRYPTAARHYLSIEEVERELIAVGTIDREYRITYLDAVLKEQALAYGALCTNGV